VRVELLARPGPLSFQRGLLNVPLHHLKVVSTRRATTLAGHGLRVGSVEHLFAALAALRVRSGLCVALDQDELPLLDGGATTWIDALEGLNLAPSAAALHITRPATIVHGDSSYRFERFEPADTPRLAIEFVVDDPRLASEARWDGDVQDFCTRIAPSRTFGWSREVDDLLAQGLASHVDPGSVVVLAEDTIHGAHFEPDEPARHKLLDLMGDLFVWGGPPNGLVHAIRPGHTATHGVMARALAEGILWQDQAC
jgi:UDP-3-O-[3-hydroxymyristoyl] N-acetylglucosamine deacetylase